MTPTTDEDPADRRGGGALRRALGDDFGRYSGLGCQLGATVTLLALAGYWADGRLGTRPWFLLVGVLLGFVGGTISIVAQVPPTSSSRKSPSEKAGRPRDGG